MSRFPILGWLKAAARPDPRPLRKCPPARRRRPARHVLQLEVLENRLTPSTLNVTSAADDGSSGTLRAMVAAATPGDTIVFDHSLNGQEIKLTQGQINLNKSLDIEGPGATQPRQAHFRVHRIKTLRLGHREGNP